MNDDVDRVSAHVVSMSSGLPADQRVAKVHAIKGRWGRLVHVLKDPFLQVLAGSLRTKHESLPVLVLGPRSAPLARRQCRASSVPSGQMCPTWGNVPNPTVQMDRLSQGRKDRT